MANSGNIFGRLDYLLYLCADQEIGILQTFHIFTTWAVEPVDPTGFLQIDWSHSHVSASGRELLRCSKTPKRRKRP